MRLVQESVCCMTVALACIAAQAYGQGPSEEITIVKRHIVGSATLKLRVVFRGEAPSLPAIESNDPFCAKKAIPDERLIVAKDGAVQNVALIWDEKKNRLPVLDNDESWRNKSVTLACQDCRLQPHILVVRAGQTLIELQPGGRQMHSLNFAFMENPIRVGLARPGNRTREISMAEPMPIPVSCDIHPFMKAYVIVKDHPYVGISDPNGVIEIDNLPVGENVFRIWHESIAVPHGATDPVEKRTDQIRTTFQLTAGLNDLGTIEFNAEHFSFLKKLP